MTVMVIPAGGSVIFDIEGHWFQANQVVDDEDRVFVRVTPLHFETHHTHAGDKK